MDRRQQKTMNGIITSFCALLNTKDYNKITVQEIIDNANIGRSTFYSHFETKDRLLTKICDDLFDHIFHSSFSDNQHISNVEEKQTVITEHILYHIQNDSSNIIGTLIKQDNMIFINSFKIYYYKIIDKYWLDKNCKLQCHINNIPSDIIRNHIYCSFLGLVKYWINSNYTLEIKDISKYYLRLLSCDK